MVIRAATPEDYDDIRAIHAAQGFDYTLPDLNHPTMFVKSLLVSDKPIAAVLGRLTSEAYLLIGNDWKSPTEKMNAICTLASTSMGQAKLRGVTDAFLWCPPEIEKSFAKRLNQMG